VLRRLHQLGDVLPDVQSSTQLLTQLLGVKGASGMDFSGTVVPVIEARDTILQALSETISVTVLITAAAGNVAGSAYTFIQVPNEQTWRILDGALSTDALDADQNLTGIKGVYTDGPLAAATPQGVLAASATINAGASQYTTSSLFFAGLEPWMRPGGRLGFVLLAPAVLGVAGAIPITLRARFARLKV
jgi:hypothetical protein